MSSSDSGDNITVATPSNSFPPAKMATTFVTPPAAPASTSASEGGTMTTSSNGTSEYLPTKPPISGPTAATVDLTIDSPSSRASSPLSEIDEEVLQTKPTAPELTNMPKELLLTSSQTAPLESSKLPRIDSSSSSAVSSQSGRGSKRGSDKMSSSETPPVKRQRKPTRAALRESTSSKEVSSPKDSASPEAEIALKEHLATDGTRDTLSTRPSRKRAIGDAGGIGARLLARARENPEEYGEVEEQGRLRGKQANKAVVKEAYEPLHLYDESNWVLFDPIKSFPAKFKEPPKCMLQFTQYKPGNHRILEYNIVSHSVRVKSTPKCLEGKRVQYTAAGPRW